MIGDIIIFAAVLLLSIVCFLGVIAVALGIVNTWSKFDDCMDKYLREEKP